MRISDWSSDVCSSDLPQPLDILARYGRAAIGDIGGGRVEQIGEIAELVADLRDDAILLRDRPAAAILAVLARAREPQRIAVSDVAERSEEHTSELQSLMRISYAVFCLKKKKRK